MNASTFPKPTPNISSNSKPPSPWTTTSSAPPSLARLTPLSLANLKASTQPSTKSLKAFADGKSQSRKHAAPALFGATGDGDPHGKTFGDWALAVARGDRNYLEKHYGSRFVEYAGKAALAEASGVTGGYTVPPDFYQQLMSIMAEETFVRPAPSSCRWRAPPCRFLTWM